MTKYFAGAALLAALLLASPPVRAQEDGEDEAPQAEAAAKPEAAAAARNKGYHAEDAVRTTTQAEDDDAPVERHDDRRRITAPPQRPLGKAERAAAAAGSGGGEASGAGIACGKSIPKLRNVQRHEIDSKSMFSGDVIRWAMGPNEAVSYRFKTPSAGTAALNTNRDTSARSVPHLMTVSQTPCDFDVDKALKSGASPNSCYAWAPVSGGIVIMIAPSKAKGCVLKPDSYYYFNRRFLSNPGAGELRDSCEDDLPVFKSQNLAPRCGGIWHAVGNVSWKK